MILATIGLHGVVAFGVARRTREIAIRLALGASRGSVRWRVIRGALLLSAIGVAAGLAGAVAMSGVLAGMLYNTAPTDPVALGLVAARFLKSSRRSRGRRNGGTEPRPVMNASTPTERDVTDSLVHRDAIPTPGPAAQPIP